MEEKITILFSSKKTTDENKDFLIHLADTCGCDYELMAVHNPDGISLSKIYNDALKLTPTNIVVLIHDDIEFLKKGWGKEILRLFNEHKDYGIIGVAGSAQFDENGAWWNYQKKFGQVLHRNNGQSWLTAFSPLLDKDLQEVAVIDGLFMAINKTKIAETFDDSLTGFDFYDINFCLSNLKAHKCKIGVTTNVRLAHNSVGALKPSWYTNREIINNKFKDMFPIDILA